MRDPSLGRDRLGKAGLAWTTWFGLSVLEGDGWLVSIRGEHDLTTALMLSETFDPVPIRIVRVADMREVTFLDAQTLRVFASAVERAAAHAGSDPTERFALVVRIEQGHLRRVLDVVRPIIGDVPTYPSRNEALGAARTRSAWRRLASDTSSRPSPQRRLARTRPTITRHIAMAPNRLRSCPCRLGAMPASMVGRGVLG